MQNGGSARGYRGLPRTVGNPDHGHPDSGEVVFQAPPALGSTSASAAMGAVLIVSQGKQLNNIAASYPAPASCGVSAFSTQNSLPSGSAMTTQLTSEPWPT
jgi:hypothetical protein